MHVAPESLVPADHLDEISHGVPHVDVHGKAAACSVVELPFQGFDLLPGELLPFVVVEAYLADGDDGPA